MSKDLEAILSIIDDPDCLEALRNFIDDCMKHSIKVINYENRLAQLFEA